MNSKKTIVNAALSIVIGIGSNAVIAQTFEWAKSFGGTNSDYGISITVDASGNLYTTGSFRDTADFDPRAGTVNLTSAGFHDIFVQKMDGSGNVVWAKSFGGASGDYGYSITVDGSGNVYTTGIFAGTVDFDPGTGTANLTSAGGSDVFVQKMDVSGNFVWAKSFGSINSDFGRSITADGSGNVYTTGYFSGTADFDPGAGTANLGSDVGSDVFVQKMDGSGNFVWAKSFGGTFSDAGNSITVDGSGNVYTTGVFSGMVDFDPGAGTVNLIAAGAYDVFVQKMDGSGNFVWAKSFGGTNTDFSNSITVDGSGNVYTAGYFLGTADFDPGVGTVNLASAGQDVFVQKMDGSGNVVWAKSFGGTSQDVSTSITVDGSGNVYTTGYFYGTADFDPGVGTVNLTAAGYEDVFVQKMDTSGNVVWAKSFGGDSSEGGNSITVDGSGNVYTTGSFSRTVDFDPGSGTVNLTSAGDFGSDIFVQKMSQGTSGVVEIEHGIQLSAYPNPSSGVVQISCKQALNNVAITVTDFQGKEVFTKHLNGVSNEQVIIDGPAGMYFLKITTATGQSVVKVIKE